MARESSIFHLTLLFIFTIGMNSAVMAKHSSTPTNNRLTGTSALCIVKPDNCTHGICLGGVCGPCPYDPLNCCLSTLGTCISGSSVPHGLCAPACSCYDCEVRKIFFAEKSQIF